MMRSNTRRILLLACLTCSIFLWTSLQALCDSEPDGITGETFGAYCGGGLGLIAPIELWEEDIKYLKKMGGAFVRFNCDFWDLLEPESGQYKWDRLDSIAGLLNREGMKMLFTVPISASWNTTADSKALKANTQRVPNSHYPARSMGDVEKLCFELSGRYKGDIEYWEVWNEPDVWVFWSGKPDAAEYVNLLKSAYAGLKRASPGCKVVIGGLAVPADDRYLNQLLMNGAAQYFDVINIHIYTKSVAELEKIVRGVKNTLSRYGADKPLWVTEISTTFDYYHSSDRVREDAEKAEFLVKAYVVLLSEGVEKIFWHTLRNCGKDAGLERDYDFGLISSSGEISPAYKACGILTSRLIGARFVRVISSGKRTKAYEFKKGGDSVYVAWSEGGKGRISLKTPYDKAIVSDMYGKKVGTFAGGRIDHPVGSAPLYIESEGITKKDAP